MRGEPNEQLRTALAEAGLSNKAFARVVRAAAAAHGRDETCDHTKVSRWLAGGQPREHTVRAICEALGTRLGRSISPEDLGFREPRRVVQGLGLSYPDSPESAVSVLADLWDADLDDTLALSATSGGTWSEASLSWLVRPGRDEIGGRAAGRVVGVADVRALTTTTEAFASLDNEFGGGHARRALIEFLRTDMSPLLRGSYSDAVGRQLYAAAAEATLLAAWMSYDAGRHGIAQRYFVQALRLAQAADQVLLAATILDAMSHQATFLGRLPVAVNLTRAASAGAASMATPTQQAHFLTMEARAHAAAGDVASTERALSRAVRTFERRTDGNDPTWISYFDDAELAAEFAHCYRDLGRGDEAVRYANMGLNHVAPTPRSDYFVTMVLAAGHLAAGDVDAACGVAGDAAVWGASLKSARAAGYLMQFRSKLAPYAGVEAVVRFDERLAGVATN